MELENRIVVVTGALGTLGRAVSGAAIAEGATVIMVDRQAGEPAEGAAASVELDLGDARATEAGLAAIAERHGRIDALVNVAGGFAWETLADGSIDTWDQMYQMNVRTAVNACKAALPHLSKGGRIVNVSSANSVKAETGLGAYTASKAGVSRLTEALAAELKSRDITVNAVQPSIIDTPPNRADMPDADFSTWVSPQALSDVILFLLSKRATAITGALIPVTGRV